MDFCIIFGVGNGGGFRSLRSDVGTEIVVETGVAFDFILLAWLIRRLIVGIVHNRKEGWDIFFMAFIVFLTGCSITKQSNIGSSGNSNNLYWLS